MKTQHNKQKVLLIDDCASIRGLVEALLQSEGIHVQSTGDSSKGVALAKATRPDLLLLDIDMPVINGFEVYQELIAEPTLLYLPVIFLTAMSTTPHKVRGLQLGAVDYITKPFDCDEFALRVSNALRRQAQVTSLRQERVDEFLRRTIPRATFEAA